MIRFPELVDDAESSGNTNQKRKLRNRLQEDMKDLFDEFNDQLSARIKKGHIDPVLNMVGVLPKDVLAATAEALVN